MSNSILPPIVFPERSEFLLRKKPRYRALRLQHVLAAVYLFGGFSALVAILSKFVLQPLFEQLCLDRSSYTRLATSLLRDLNVKLSKVVSKVPSVQVERSSGPSYVSAQTQTDDKVAPFEHPAFRPPSEKVSNKNLALELENLATHSELDTVSSLKESLEKLNGMTAAMRFPSYSSRIVSDLKNFDQSPKEEKNVVEELMKEIRSIKGSLLSARNFPNARSS